MQFEKAYSFLLKKFDEELHGGLTYHNSHHTRQVVNAARYLAEKENLSVEESEMVLTAALFHDAGFLNTYEDHESASCDLAREVLPRFNYSDDQIETICRIIMVTSLPQTPTNKMEQVMCDADLHYLGTDGYYPNAENLYKEFRKQGLVANRKEWNQKQVMFLGAHRFFTATAKQEFEAKKQDHLVTLTSNGHGRISRYSWLSDALLIVLGVFIAGFALKGFLVPNLFFDGGVTGLSLLLHELYHFNLAYVIIILNLPFIVAGYFSVSKKFAFKTLAAVIMLGCCLLFFPYPVITSDKLLISIFGGVFLGLGIGFTMRAGCALDGIEVLALYTLKRTSFTITEIILGLNIIIFSIAAFKFGTETALYSVLTYFAASRMIDYVIEGIQAYTGVTIISGESERIKYQLVNELGRGITIYKGERGFLPGKFEISSNCDIIFTVVTRLELRKLKNLVYSADPKAFVFANTIKEASGGIIKKLHRH